MKNIVLAALAAIFAFTFSAVAASPEQLRYEDIADQKFTDARFQGGDVTKYRAWAAKKVNYSKMAKKTAVAGKTTVEFVVDRDGVVTKVNVVEAPSEELRNQFLKVLRMSPNWKPATINGQPIAVKHSFTINYNSQAEAAE